MEPYDNYEISPCRRYDDTGNPNPNGKTFEVCQSSEADVWTLYGHLTEGGVEAIGDFASEEHAGEIYHRITGHPFGSHDENAARVRLMQAATDMISVLEPYAVEAKNRINETAASGDDWEAIKKSLQPLLDACEKALGRPAGAEAVMRQIERLIATRFFADWGTDEMTPQFMALAIGIPDFYYTWSDLSGNQQMRALEKHIDWDGFDWEERDAVKKNVLAGKPKQQWLEGVGGAL